MTAGMQPYNSSILIGASLSGPHTDSAQFNHLYSNRISKNFRAVHGKPHTGSAQFNRSCDSNRKFS